MQRILGRTSHLIALSFVVLLTAHFSHAAQGRQLTIVIDPGHGGRDKGASRKNVFEADITLKVGQYLNELLKKDRQFKPVLSRANEQGLSLNERARIAKNTKADLLLSIHVNSNPDPRARGAEFYFQNQLQPDEESMFLAHKENSIDGQNGEAPTYDFLERHQLPGDVAGIVTDLLDGDRVWRSSTIVKALRTNWRGFRKGRPNGVRQAPFFVLSQMTTPSALVELGFLTNAEDFADLTNDDRLKAMAEDLYRGLKAYKESIDKARTNF